MGFSYDANGSTLADASNGYSYNAAGRLAAANTASYVYNGKGERVAKTVNSATTLFSYDEAGHLLGEYNGQGNPIEETLWLGDIPLATVNSLGTYYIHSDHLNTPRQIDDRNKAAVWSWDTITFGATLPNQNPQGAGNPFVYNLRMAGQYYDAESGLFHNGWRDYAPGVGRYVESDPIGLGGGSNTYAYVSGNPVSLVDPTGTQIVVPTPIGPLPLPIGPTSPVKPGAPMPPILGPCLSDLANCINDSTDGSTGTSIGGNIYDATHHAPPPISDKCVEKCLPLLERPKRFPGDDSNYWDYIQCLEDCRRDHDCH